MPTAKTGVRAKMTSAPEGLSTGGEVILLDEGRVNPILCLSRLDTNELAREVLSL